MENKVIFLSGSSNPNLSYQIANGYYPNHYPLSLEQIQIISHKFPNGELRVQIPTSVRSKEVFLIQTGSQGINQDQVEYNLNDCAMEFFLSLDALNRAGCQSITAIIPNFFYARQDRKDEGRVPISSKMFCNFIENSRVDRIIALDLHSSQIQGFSNIPFHNVYSAGLVKEELEQHIYPDLSPEERRNNYILVSPDAGAMKRSLKFASILGLETMMVEKRRGVDGKITNMFLICDEQYNLSEMTPIVCDDIADTCGTIITCCDLLVDKGMKPAIVFITHGIFSNNAITKIDQADSIQRFFVSDSVDQTRNITKSNKLSVFSIGKLISKVAYNIINGISTSEIY